METEANFNLSEDEVIEIVKEAVGDMDVAFKPAVLGKVLEVAHLKGYNIGWDLGHEAGIAGTGLDEDEDDTEEDDEE